MWCHKSNSVVQQTNCCQNSSSYWASCQGIYHCRGRLPPKLWSLLSWEDDDVNPSTGNPNQGGGTPGCLQAELGDLTDRELWQLMEYLQQEIALCELHAPPSNLQPTPWGKPSGSGNYQKDDLEVTFPRGGSWGPLGQPSPTLAPEGPGGGWVPLGSPPQPLRPALADLDMGHLINTLVSGLHLGPLWINTFSGKAMLGKTEVSFEQWYHEVQGVKDHYSESVVQESIVQSLKGAVADMAQYMGPTASVREILQKLMVIFGMVASFGVLMQNFYKVTQGNNEKVPSFATRLEDTLNQIQLKCPGIIADCKVACHLKDQLFHRVHKHIPDSIRYLHGNPKTMYSQLMVAARKVESKNEDAKEKVKARSWAATEVSDGSKELGNQIAWLMAALNRAEQDTHPASAPNSPRHRGCGRGRMDRNTPVCPSSLNGWTGLSQNTFTHSSSNAGRITTASEGRGSTQASTGAQGNAQNTKDPITLQCFRCQGWGHMARECATPSKQLNKDGGTKGMWSNPLQYAPSKFATFPPWPQSKTNSYEGTKEEGMATGCPHTVSQSGPNSMSYRALQWSPCNYRWAGSCCLDRFGGLGFKNKCSIVWRPHLRNSAPGSVVGARGDGGCSHPIPQICGGKPPDSGDKRLQWGCAAVGYSHHNLL